MNMNLFKFVYYCFLSF